MTRSGAIANIAYITIPRAHCNDRRDVRLGAGVAFCGQSLLRWVDWRRDGTLTKPTAC
jgi:hypothetical protein